MGSQGTVKTLTPDDLKSLGVGMILANTYRGNQKTCYKTALSLGADIVIMLHPDYQYTPRLIRAMASLLAEGLFDCVLGSRILGVGALKGGMPRYKYISNRFLTLVQNLLLPYKLSEYHTVYRAFTREVLESIPIEGNSDNFIFDNQMLAQIIYAEYSIGETSCPTRYLDTSSSINFSISVIYGLGVLKVSLAYRLSTWGIHTSPLFASLSKSRRSQPDSASNSSAQAAQQP